LSDDRWHEVDDLFTRALDLDPAARPAFLDAACPDPALRARVERLLADAERDSGTFAPGAAVQGALGASLARAGGADAAAPEPPGIPGFRFIRALGLGGMGVVWLAEQLEPVRRPVAVKVIRADLAAPQFVARFESERQALALMNHPHIARVYDGGTTAGGDPYFVMEYVSGLPITAHCAERRLSVRAKLELFIAVCDAVHHAHLRGVIHRDLKPSNVLIAEDEGFAVPKVIDFGIARALDQRLTERTLLTMHGQIVGTPEYMSPEQAQLEPADVDARSDVFALGIMLYELLTGTRPFRADAPGITSLERLFSMIRNDDPPRPSRQIAANRASGADTAPGTLARELRGDLDWIVMKTLEKDRGSRYGSARELADDLRRHLRHEPVVAGPPSTTYRIRKLVRRHRALVTAAAAVTVALVLGIAASLWQAVRATQAEQVARHEAATAQRVSDFLVELFETSDPAQARGDTLTAREVLDRGRDRLRRELAHEPLVQARLLGVVADIYRKLGLYDDAEPLFAEAIEVRARELGEDDLEVARARQALGRLAVDRGQDDRADSLFLTALARYERAPSAADLDAAQVFQDMSEVVRRKGRYAEAESLALLSVRRFEAALGAEDDRIAMGWIGVGTARARQGRFAEAEEAFRTSLEMHARLLGPDHPEIAIVLADLTSCVGAQGRDAEAEAYGRRALAITEKAYGPRHRFTASSLTNLAGSLGRQGRLAEARELFERALDIRLEVFGADDPQTAIDYKNLGMTTLLQADYAAAQRWLERSLEVDARVLGDRHPRVAWNHATLGGLMLRTGRYADAAQHYEAGLAALRASIGVDNPEAARCLRGLGDVALERRRFAEADTLYARAMALFESRGGPKGSEVPPTLRRVGVLRLEQGRLAGAVETLARALALGEEVYGRDDHPAIAETLVPLARARAAGGDPEQAERLLRRALEIAEKAHGPDHPDAAMALHGLGEVLARRGERDEAARCLGRALEIRRAKLGAAHPDTRLTMAARAALDGAPAS